MGSKLNPYLSFKSNAREVMEFYKSVFGGDLDLRTFKDFHISEGPSEDNLIMHSALVVSDSITIMASDTRKSMDYQPGANVSLSLTGDNESELRGYFEKLCDGGKVTLPLEKAMWGDTFGMCTDKFGTNWLVSIEPVKTN